MKRKETEEEKRRRLAAVWYYMTHKPPAPVVPLSVQAQIFLSANKKPTTA